MKTIRTLLLTLALLVGIATFLPSTVAVAQTPAQEADKGLDAVGGSNAAPITSVIRTIINVFLFLIGGLAVVMIIYGGFRYVSSAGDSSAVSSAKNVILYSVVGLVVALSAYAIVNFVIDRFSSSNPPYDPNSTSNSPDPNLPYGPTP